MVFKLNIAEKGKTWKVELQDEALVGTAVGDTIDGKEIKADLEGYQLVVTGGSDLAGFPMSKDVEGLGLRRVLFTRGWGMRDTRKGLRLRKTVRGKQISLATSQINLMVTKAGKKPLAEIFPEQNAPKVKAEEKKVEAEPAAPAAA